MHRVNLIKPFPFWTELSKKNYYDLKVYSPSKVIEKDYTAAVMNLCTGRTTTATSI